MRSPMTEDLRRKKIKKAESSKATSYVCINIIESLRPPTYCVRGASTWKKITSGLSYLRHNEKFKQAIRKMEPTFAIGTTGHRRTATKWHPLLQRIYALLKVYICVAKVYTNALLCIARSGVAKVYCNTYICVGNTYKYTLQLCNGYWRLWQRLYVFVLAANEWFL